MEFDAGGIRRATLVVNDTRTKADVTGGILNRPEVIQWAKSMKSYAPIRLRLNNQTVDMLNDAQIQSVGRKKLTDLISGMTEVLEGKKRGYTKSSMVDKSARHLIASEKSFEAAAKVLKAHGYAIIEDQYNRTVEGGPLSLEQTVGFSGR